jgi:hypothetical protein
MAKTYWLSFGNTDPRTYAGLAPTFIQFFDQTGATLSPPAISAGMTGWYKFNYSVGYSTSIAFLVDGATTGLPSDIRYIRGVLDPVDTMDLVIGYTASSFGTTAVPQDLFGYMRRTREWLEGVQNFVSSSGVWNVYDKGASVLLGAKTLTSSTTGVTAIP